MAKEQKSETAGERLDRVEAALGAIEGLELSDCLRFFDSKATDRDKQIVELVDTEDERFECDNLIVSEGDDNGAYVLGWRWASFEGTELDKEKEDDEAA
jgi:hypothetical protein